MSRNLFYTITAKLLNSIKNYQSYAENKSGVFYPRNSKQVLSLAHYSLPTLPPLSRSSSLFVSWHDVTSFDVTAGAWLRYSIRSFWRHVTDVKSRHCCKPSLLLHINNV